MCQVLTFSSIMYVVMWSCREASWLTSTGSCHAVLGAQDDYQIERIPRSVLVKLFLAMFRFTRSHESENRTFWRYDKLIRIDVCGFTWIDDFENLPIATHTVKCTCGTHVFKKSLIITRPLIHFHDTFKRKKRKSHFPDSE
jgi:hypothetical protein